MVLYIHLLLCHDCGAMRCVVLVYRLLVFVTLYVWHAGLYVSLLVLCFVLLLVELICVLYCVGSPSQSEELKWIKTLLHRAFSYG